MAWPVRGILCLFLWRIHHHNDGKTGKQLTILYNNKSRGLDNDSADRNSVMQISLASLGHVICADFVVKRCGDFLKICLLKSDVTKDR